MLPVGLGGNDCEVLVAVAHEVVVMIRVVILKPAFVKALES